MFLIRSILGLVSKVINSEEEGEKEEKKPKERKKWIKWRGKKIDRLE